MTKQKILRSYGLPALFGAMVLAGGMHATKEITQWKARAAEIKTTPQYGVCRDRNVLVQEEMILDDLIERMNVGREGYRSLFVTMEADARIAKPFGAAERILHDEKTRVAQTLQENYPNLSLENCMDLFSEGDAAQARAFGFSFMAAFGLAGLVGLGINRYLL